MGTRRRAGWRLGDRGGFCRAGVLMVIASLSTTACTTGDLDELVASLGQPVIAPNGTASEVVDTAGLKRIAKATEDNETIDAASLYRRIIEREPSDAEPRIRLGQVLLRRGDVDGAEAAFRDATKLSPDSVDAQIGSAQVLLARNRFMDASVVLSTVLKGDKSNVRGLGSMGLAMDGLGRPGEAQSYYRQALQVDPGNTVVRNNLGLSLARSGQHDQAIEVLQKLADEPGAAPRYRENLARAIAMRDGKQAP
jgi:Flp pilus assembly protein TadD